MVARQVIGEQFGRLRRLRAAEIDHLTQWREQGRRARRRLPVNPTDELRHAELIGESAAAN